MRDEINITFDGTLDFQPPVCQLVYFPQSVSEVDTYVKGRNESSEEHLENLQKALFGIRLKDGMKHDRSRTIKAHRISSLVGSSLVFYEHTEGKSSFSSVGIPNKHFIFWA